MVEVYLLLGSNLQGAFASPEEVVEKAREKIEQQVGRIVRATDLVRFPAWGYDSTNDFYNQIVVVTLERFVGCRLSDSSQKLHPESSKIPDGLIDCGRENRVDSQKLHPEQLLDELIGIEVSLGRGDKAQQDWQIENRSYKDRVIDIDILYIFEDSASLQFSSPRLEIPHPRIGQREFVQELLGQLE